MNMLKQNHLMQQQLALTPSLKQSLTILSFNIFDLTQFIQQQAESNPLLEVSSDWYDKVSFKDSLSTSQQTLHTQDFYQDSSNTIDIIDQQLSAQVHLLKIDKRTKKILFYLISNLNQYGYLDCELQEVTNYLHCSLEEVQEALEILQSFEPAGIGATNLSECLILQLREKASVPKYTKEILINHLELIASKQFARIAEIFDCSTEHIEEVLKFIQTLNPRPINKIEEVTEYIIPDLILTEEQGELILSINDDILPEISISNYYQELINESKEVKAYVNQKYNEILLLKTGIKKRNITLYKVAKEIVDAQSTFFLKDGDALVPLRLRDISEKVGLHESTVWRTVNSKYIQTPKGTYALKYFLVRGLLNEFGDNQNIDVIKQNIKMFIEKENPLYPLSDSKIVNLLSGKGIKIARRTVAKYREQLKIPASSKRKLKE